MVIAICVDNGKDFTVLRLCKFIVCISFINPICLATKAQIAHTVFFMRTTYSHNWTSSNYLYSPFVLFSLTTHNSTKKIHL